MKMKYIGNFTPVDSKTVIKTYHQEVAGSAFKKIGTDLLLLKEAGYDNIIVRFNDTHPNVEDMLYLTRLFKKYIPGLKIEVLNTVQAFDGGDDEYVGPHYSS